MLSKCQPVAPKHKFKFKNPLYGINATLIKVCLSLFNWAKFRTTKGAVKLHVKLNHSGYLPLEPEDVAVFDRGFVNFAWFATLCERNIPG